MDYIHHIQHIDINKIVKVGCAIVLSILVACVICLFINKYSKQYVEKFTDGEPNDNYTSLLTKGFVIPPYAIVAYAGTSSEIPTGWALCNGQNGTPDLRNKFIYGGSSQPVSGTATGGASSVTLVANNLPEHTHTGRTSENGRHGHSHSCASDDGGGNDNHYAKGDNNSSRGCDLDRAGDHTHSFTTDVNTTRNSSFSILPPYYKLAYLMKLPN